MKEKQQKEIELDQDYKLDKNFMSKIMEMSAENSLSSKFQTANIYL